MKMRFVPGVMVVLLAVAAPAALCQTLYTIHGGVVGTSNVSELKGPPSLPTGYPGGPVVSTFPTTVPFGCATVGALGTPPVSVLGDVAVDMVGDVVWATDGATITSYSPAGVPLNSFPVPFPLGPLTGLGFNSAAGALVMTDGVLIMGAAAVAPGCGAPALGAFFPSPSAFPLTDIEWDPASGTFFGCDSMGFVTNIAPGGGIGPFGVFPVVGLCAPGLGPKLQGLAVDTTTLGPPVLYVTDGFKINRISPPGVVAAPTFSTPASCFPVLTAAPINGLAYSLHAVSFSLPCHTAGGMLPAITSTGHSTVPGLMTVGITGAAPAGLAMLMITPFLGPPVAFKGCSLLMLPTTSFTFPVGPLGTFVLPLPIAPATPVGVSVYMQWLCVSGGGIGITPGLELTFGEP